MDNKLYMKNAVRHKREHKIARPKSTLKHTKQ